MEKVVLVDSQDNQIGLMEKMEAHKKGLLHRAFSIFIFNSKGEMLLQKRALSKYHCGGLWANTCCSHPREHESTDTAATRRLKEEMGFETPLSVIFNFTYKADLDKNLTEHEFDHVFVGYYDGEILLNKDEVDDYAYETIDAINERIKNNPSYFTPWFLIAFPRVVEWWQTKQL